MAQHGPDEEGDGTRDVNALGRVVYVPDVDILIKGTRGQLEGIARPGDRTDGSSVEAPALDFDRVVTRVPHNDVSLFTIAGGQKFSVGRELDGCQGAPVLLYNAGLVKVVSVESVDVHLGVLFVPPLIVSTCGRFNQAALRVHLAANSNGTIVRGEGYRSGLIAGVEGRNNPAIAQNKDALRYRRISHTRIKAGGGRFHLEGNSDSEGWVLLANGNVLRRAVGRDSVSIRSRTNGVEAKTIVHSR